MATVIIQARMQSTRLPGKVLKPICGKPLIHYIIKTLRLSPVIDNIIIATSTNIENDIIEKFAKDNSIVCFRGSEENVLERFYMTSQKYPDNYYFRATADNPLLDSTNPKKTLDFLIKNKLDYASVKGMPIGTIIECFTRETLEKTYNSSVSIYDKEHVTSYMKKSGVFNIGFLEAEQNIRFPKMRLTVDLQQDFDKAEKIISALYGSGIPKFEEIVDFVNNNL